MSGAASKRISGQLKAAQLLLARAGVESVSTNARILMEFTLGVRDLSSPKRELLDHEVTSFQAAVARRCAREPLQYIIGEWDFDMLQGLICRPPVLIPRPESEELVGLVSQSIEAAVDNARAVGSIRKFRLLEVGTGSGAISIALLKRHPEITAVGIDIAPAAVALTRENSVRQGVADRMTVIQADAATFLPPRPQPEESTLSDRANGRATQRRHDPVAAARFDMLVANLPYVTSEEYSPLQPEVVSHEDKGALVGDAPAGAGLILSTLTSALQHGWLRPAANVWLETNVMHPPLLSFLLDTLPPRIVARQECIAASPHDPPHVPPYEMDLAWLCAGTGMTEEAVMRLYERAAPLRQHYLFINGYEDYRGVPRFAHLQVKDKELEADADSLTAFLLEVGLPNPLTLLE